MKRILALVLALPLALHAHTLPPQDKEALRAHILEEFMQKAAPKKVKPVEAPVPKMLKRPVTVAGLSAFDLSSFLTSGSALPPAGNGALMAASFAPFKPKVRYNWDGTTFFLESDNTPEGMPNKMFGITTWQQQVPIPAAYFAHSTSNENNAGSLGYQQPNVWRIPLVPVPSASPIVIYNPPAPPTNFLRGAVALASNGIAIFNPSNNGGNVSYEIGELDYYGGHCGLADDYHYHIAPTHLNTRFGGPLGDDKPIAWALDGYPMYGFVEPDGSPRQALDAEGGHDHGGGWGYHYHAMGTTTVDATHPYGTPQSPYLMKAFHGTVVNFGNQVDGQPAVGNLRADGTGGYNAKAVAGAYIVAQMNPAPLVVDGSGHLNLIAGVNLTGCATTYGSTTVTCASTTGLTAGLAVVGYGVSNGARIASVTNATQFVLTIPAIGTTTGKNFNAVSMAAASPDAHLMRVNMGGVDYDECWTINRKVNPRSLTMTWRAQALVGGQLSGPVLTTTQTYTPTAGSASGNRLTAYPMSAWSEVKLPDTSQAISTTTTFGEDSDYTTTPSANPQSFTDNGDGTITDNVTGLMWQKADAGEMTWENAVNNTGTVTTGGYSDWRLPNPHELMSLFNYEAGNPAMNATYFPPASPSAEYWWSRDVFGTSTTNVWCVNSGGGVGPKPKAETVSAGGTLRYHARYVRLAQNNMTHNYVNNLDCTITDTDTSLMWTQMPSTAMTWEAALAWAEGLTLGGYNDWRMPNIKELQTLTDYSLATTSGGTATNLKPCINRTMFAKTMSGCSVTSGSPVVATSDTTDLVIGMTVIDPFSIAGTYINHTTTPTITAINPGVSFTLSSNALSTGTGLIFRALPRATAYWSSTSLKGNTTEAWLLELGVNNAVTPPRGAQGIISYQAKSASFPVFAVRSVPAGSVTQGLATTTTSNLFPPGQRVSAVGTITATDNTTWTVPAATLYTSAEKAPDLYNEYNSVTPANLAAAQAAIAALPTKVIDADGEVVTGYIFADNYFELYVNGVLVGVDPVPFTAFNSCVVKFKAKRPITYAVRLVDWEENLGLGTELNGGDPHHIGDGGFIASFSDGTVTGSDWKAQTFYIAPLDDPNQVVELVNGTRSSAGATHTLTTTAYAMHYPLPDGWFSSGFSTAGWPAAMTYSEAQVGANSPAYMNFQPQFTGSGAQFIWSSSLTLDNEVILRYTGPATTPTQIAVEQPAGTPLADGASTVAYGSVSIGSTLTKTFTIRNNGSTTLSITGVTVDGVNAANFSVIAAPASSIAAGASTTMDVRFDASSGGARTAALHIACSDPAVGAAFDIDLTGTGLVPPPTISNITVNPISPSATDSPVVTAQITPGSGGSISGVSLQYDLGAQVTGNVFRETFSMSSSNNWNGSGGLNTWTTNGAGATRQANLQSNRTSPVVLTNCTTTSASTTVACGSTANLWPGMIITGPGMAAGAMISSITNSTTFVASAAATASSTTATLTANGITLTNCTTTAASTTVTCDSTVGLVAGMGLTGTGLANNATVSSITNATTFVMSAAPTTPGTALTLTGNGNALEFQAASASLTTAMATSPVINAAGTSGYVDFHVQTRDLNSLSPNNQWAFQVSPDGGTTWNTRITEDWTSNSVTLTNVVTNAAGSGTGSTTVTCASTAGLTTGRVVSAAPVYVTGGTTSGSATVTCTNTTGLAVGMFVTSNGQNIPNNTRITAINPNVDFTMSANAATTSATAAIAGNYFPANASVSSITNGTTLVLNAAAYVNTSSAPITAFATTINHNFNTKADGTAQPYRYTLDASERTANMRMRFQYAGGTVTQPTRAPRVSIDDIVVNTTSGAPPTVLTMVDDGTNGDAVSGDGIWTAVIPAQADGETVNFTIAATGSGGAGTTTSSTTSYTVAPAPTITTTSPLPSGSTTGAYSQTFAATGGSGTGYVWSLFSGSLPNGLTLSSGGVLSGTPTQAGNFTFTIEVTDSANRSATKAFALTITTVTAPNVLIILTDDQGWGDIGYHTPAGQIPIQTPRMDGFLNSGIRLENFYATTVCSVTRATLMTGRNQLRTGVNNTHGLALSEHIMPQTFKAAGYQTYMCGKWHIGGSDKNLGYTTVNGQNVRVIQEGLEYAPYNRGWDLHYGQYSGAIQYSTHNSNEALNPDLPDWWLNGVQQDGLAEHTDSQGHGGYSTDLLADKAVSCIQNRDPSKPMLLWLAFNAIHGPVSAPAEYLAKYSSITNTNRRTIAAAVDCMDAAIGRVLDQLTASGIADNTIVVFMSDNGGQESGGSLNDPLRGTKGDSWDGGVHMPAAISWPGVLATNVVSKQYVWVGDIFPTLCAATGVTAQNTEPFDGLNLWPALLSINSGNPDGPARPLDKPLVTISAAPITLNRFTDPVNGGEKVFKLIRNKVGQSVVNELYNMTDDVDPATGAPIESTDLLLGPNAAAYSAIVTSLTTAVTDITPINYPPYIGPPLITNTVSQGGNITLYAPFSSWPKTAPTVQWRKNGVNIPGGTFAQVMDIDSVVVAGGYAAKLDLTGVTAVDAGSYDVVITNAGGTTTSAAGTLTVTPTSGSTTITNVATAPTAPTYLDPVWVLAQVQAAPGATISQVQLSYDLGVPVSTRVFQENFAITGTTTWNGTGAMNAWTTTAATANHVRQTTGTANHSIPVLLSNCSTTVGSSNVTCDSTSGLWPGMIITGVNVPAGATISSVASGTSFVVSAAATGSGSALSLTAGGVTLTTCTTTAASTTVICDSTAGLTPGMSLSGTGLANNASVSSITDATTFVMNAAPTTPGSNLTISVAGAGAEFQTGTASLTDAMFATTNAINASGASGYIEFYAQTRDLAAANNCGWTFQVSSDGGTNWNTRIAEDWNSSSVPLANCVLNAAGSVGGSTTVTCADTSALTSGRSVVGPTAYVTGGITNGQPTVTTASTSALAVGMFLQGSTGIPNNTRILTIDSATQFTMTANATATDAAVAIAGTYFAGNATVASITNGTTFVLNSPAYVNTSAAPIAASATTLNHGFQLYHYDLVGAELGAGLKMRWQFAGYSPTQPTRAPRVDVDDIIVATTSTPPPVALTMYDDGLHGDGAANDGWWGAAIPAQSGGTTVNFHVTATDSNGQSATSPVSSSYTYSVNASLTDATVKGAEFLGMPKDTSMTLNMVFAVDQEMFVEYGTTPGSYPFATTTALYSIDGAKPEFFNPAEITIQGLQPDTEYYYRVRHRAPGAPYFTARGERSFHTARPRGTTFTFTVTADPHIDVNTDMQLFWRAMQNISLDAPDIHLDIGDIFMTDKLADGLLGVPPRYKGGQPLSQATLNERAVFFRNQFERACHSIPFFFTLGNHEAEYGYLFNAAGDKQNNIPAWDLKSRKAFYPTPVPDAFYTGNPTPKDYTGGTLGLLEDYYAFEWGEALFIVLDPFWNVSTNPNQADDAWEWTLGKAQYDWLRDSLWNSSARYKFIFMHHIVGGSTQQANGTPQFAARGGIEVSDRFEWGGKNADGSPGFATKRPGWDMPIHDLLALNKVNVVFHGHDHLYGYQTKDGVVYLECPQPGTPNYGSFGSAADGQYVNLGANSSSYLLPNSGHIRVTVGPDQAVADYVRSYRTATDPMPPDATSVFNDENASRHNRDISHSFFLAPKISPPIEVANVGPGQVGLRWNAVPNKPYEIQWTTDLKTWTTIDTLTFTNTHTNATYTDTLPARVNGQRAFYRVRYTP